jgi:hypothetical protein
VLNQNQEGGYRFIGVPGAPYSNGAVADAGLDLVRARFARPVPLEAGLKAAGAHVRSAGRPVVAITGFEVRIPKPLSRSSWGGFNETYIAHLKALGLQVDGLMPAARTNVSPTEHAVAEPSVHAFTYTAPGRRDGRAFVLAGVAEDKPGDVGSMLDSIMGQLGGRLQDLDRSWEDATALQLYGLENTQGLLVDRVLKRLRHGVGLGIHWYPSLPPIDDLHLEIDVRSAGAELVLPV